MPSAEPHYLPVMSRALHVLSAAAAVMLTLAAAATAQPAPRPAYAVVGGFALRAPEAFGSNSVCPAKGSASISVRQIRPLGRSFATEVMVDAWTGAPHPECVASPVPPPPTNGPYTRTAYQSRYTGYPFLQTGFRLTAMPLAGRGLDLRLSAGISRAWSRHLWIPEAAVAAVIGRGVTRGLLEAGIARYSIPLTTTAETYQAGAVVNSVSTDQPIRTLSVVLRLGLVLNRPPGRTRRSRGF